MKIYKFFKIPDDNDDIDIETEQKYVLYAITNKKKYAERFKEDRNMDKFIFKIDKNVSEDEYANICNEYNNRGAVLDLYSLTTIFNKNHTKRNSVQKKVLMTYWEKQMVEDPNTLFDDERFWEMMPYPLIFKSKYSNALEVLQFTAYYKLMAVNFISYYMMEKLSTEDDDYSTPSLEFDEVRLFIDQIKSTL